MHGGGLGNLVVGDLGGLGDLVVGDLGGLGVIRPNFMSLSMCN